MLLTTRAHRRSPALCANARARTLAAALLLLALPLACSIATSPALSRQQLADRIARGDAPFVLDVRTGGEYREGHVPGAMHISFLSVGSRIDEIPVAKDQPIVIYCAHGPRAAWAARKLRKAGFSDVTYLDGHMSAWEEDGLPMERVPEEREEQEGPGNTPTPD
jgi:hydroxyacylglutathione hydrolase